MSVRNFLLVLVILFTGACSTPPDSSLSELEKTLNQKDVYDEAFKKRIELLQEVCAEQDNPEKEYAINRRIAIEFSSYSMDSSISNILRNLDIAKNLHNKKWQTESELMLIDQYTTGGSLLEASDLLRTLDDKPINGELKLYYLQVTHHLAHEQAVHADYKPLKQLYEARCRSLRTSLLSLLEPGSYLWLELQWEEAYQEGNLEKAADYARQMMVMVEKGTHAYAKAAFLRQEALPKMDPERQSLLIESAVSDIIATKDYESLNVITQELFARGDVRRAYSFSIRHCLPDALFFNGRMRTRRIAEFILEIEQAHSLNEQNHQSHLILISGVISLLFAVVVILLVGLSRRQRYLLGIKNQLENALSELEVSKEGLTESNQRLLELNTRLKEADAIKEEYIVSYLKTLSEYITSQRQYKNQILRNLKRGNVKFIIEDIEMEPPIEEDIRDFYRMFDQTFISLYPNFVEDVNALFKEDAAFRPTEDILSPELRILGLIKLGISDPRKIAVLLHYSTKTVYNYRANVKNAFLGDRNDFEDAIRNI